MSEIRHLKNRQIATIQRKNHPISMKCVYTTANLELDDSQMTKYENL